MKKTILGILGMLLMVLSQASLQAATITVTSNADSGPGSLREALSTIGNNSDASNTILFTPGIGTITLTTGYLDLYVKNITNKSIIIDGGTNGQVISANNASRILGVSSDVPSYTTIKNIHFKDGKLTDDTGAAITHGSNDHLTLIGCTISNCTAINTSTDNDLFGSTIFTAGDLSIINSTITDCHTISTTIKIASGAIANSGSGENITIDGCTIINNDCTIAAGNAGAFDFYNTGSLTIKNSIIAFNTKNGGTSINTSGTLTESYNLTDGDNLLADATDITNSGFTIGALADNGGPTPTCKLSPGSVAIDAITSGGQTLDQRGFVRPGRADIGAYEYITTTWNGTAWNNGAPAKGIYANVTGDYLIADGISCTDLTIQPNVHLSNLTALNISGNLLLKSDASGTASLLGEGTISVGGTSKVEQFITGSNNSGTINGRFWYVSSPVSGATSAVFDAASTNKLWQYNEASHAYYKISDNTTSLEMGRGYCTRMAADATLTFEGTLNNGDKTINLTLSGTDHAKRGYNLIGNPYPSHLDWSMATKTDVGTTIWCRTQGNFATYNSAGGESTLGMTQDIAPMQAVWVKATSAAGSVSFTNAMRSHQAGKLLKGTSVHPLVRLKVSNSKTSDEAVIYFDGNASNDLDTYDSEKMSNENDTIPEIYSLTNTKQIAINGLKNLSTKQDVILGFKTGKAGSFTINASEIKNFEEGTSIVLEDKLLGIRQNLIENPSYAFSSEIASSDARFVVHFTKSTTDVAEADGSQGISIFKSQDKQITVKLNGLASCKGQISICSVTGQKMMSKDFFGEEAQFAANYADGVYLITVQVDGKQVTKKISITN